MKHTFQKSELATLCLVLGMLVLTIPSSDLAANSGTVGAQPTGRVLRVPNDHGSIQAAVNAAAEGAIILVERGVYSENLVVTTPGLRLHGITGAVLDGASVGGIGVHVLGTAAEPVTGVEISGFEVRNFATCIVLERTLSGRVHRNEVHSNGRGILLLETRLAEITGNAAHHNGLSGIAVSTGSSENLVRANRIVENGSQLPNYNGFGLVVTGAGAHDNQILENPRDVGQPLWLPHSPLSCVPAA